MNTGTSVILINLAGSGTWDSSGDNFTNTVLSDSSIISINSIVNGSGPHTGNYYPSDNTTRTYLNSFNGENINSTWRVTVEDTYASLDNVTLVKWSLRFNPTEQEKTVTSNVITTMANLFNSDNIESLIEGSSIYIGSNPSSSTTNDAMFNNAYGIVALSSLTTGNRNFSLGYASLQNCNTGNSNVAIGIDSQQQNTSGSSNIGIGNSTLRLNINQHANIAIGESALFNLTSGYENIAIGYYSGNNQNNITNQIVIGHYTDGNGSNTATIGNNNITKLYMNKAGTAEIYANGTINTSDKRLKENIQATSLGLHFINQLLPVSYTWKNNKNSKISEGLLAQDVEQTMNTLNRSKNTHTLVNYDESNDKYGINYSELIGPLIKAVQELSTENKELKERLLILENKMS